MTRPTPKSPKCTTIFALANEDKPLNKRWFIIVYVYGKRVKHQPCKYVYIIFIVNKKNNTLSSYHA